MAAARFARTPCAPLRPFVRTFWAIDGTAEPDRMTCFREHVLPTGDMHVVIRLSDAPLCVFRPHDTVGTAVSSAVTGGARDTYYVRAGSGPLVSIGAQLRAGGAEALLGVPAGELSGRHTDLFDLLGAVVSSIRDQLLELPTLAQRIDALERFFLARMPRVRAMHPAVAEALANLTPHGDVHRIVAATGYSHRTMLTWFRRSVGLSPKQYARVLRFAAAVQRLRRGGALADVAAAAGYSDQAHFAREFRELAGTTPSTYRRINPAAPHHIPITALLGE